MFVALKDGLSSVREIATAYDISRNHLVKVVHRLSQLGYIRTYQGKGGGMELALPAGDINIGEVVRKTESLALVECLCPQGGSCVITRACVLKSVLIKARNAFLHELDKHTLADLVTPGARLSGLLAANASLKA